MNAAACSAQGAWRGELRNHEPLARHTVWACGGPAERFYIPADLDDLCAFVAGLAPDEPVFWLGLGSNLLVRDGGLHGTVIAMAGALDGIDIDGQMLSVLAGTPCAKVARAAARAHLDGAAFLAGIPGTLGGALAMNAGAFGGETWPLVQRVRTLDRAGALRWRQASDFEVAYRHVHGPADEWFVACELLLQPIAGEAETDAREAIRALLAKRSATQPTGQRSCGSVFRNPPGDAAGRLIEACGLKGVRIGGAVVSEKHANFIINDDNARASDIEALIHRVRDAVRAHHGVELVPEVRIVGEPAP